MVVAVAAAGVVGCSSSSPAKPDASLPKPTATTPKSDVSSPPSAGSVPTPESSPPTGATPIRAAFYYPWFPEAWAQQGQNPFTNYHPTPGFYSTDIATVRSQIAEMQFGRISVGIASWFGRATTTDKHWPTLIAAARGTGFAWAPYYEPEGISDPTPTQISSDLDYLHTRYGAGSGLAALANGAMPVFVYNADDLTHAKGCDTVARWTAARALSKRNYGLTIYVDLKVFARYKTCPGAGAIDGWHQYEPSSAAQDFSASPGDGSYSISPGYWKAGSRYGVAPFLARNLQRWQVAVVAMGASRARWQLITTFNEWGEGTAVEGASSCRTAAPLGADCDWGAGMTSKFLDVLHAAPSG